MLLLALGKDMLEYVLELGTLQLGEDELQIFSRIDVGNAWRSKMTRIASDVELEAGLISK